MCDNGQCVSMDAVCDTVPDCFDRSDEHATSCPGMSVVAKNVKLLFLNAVFNVFLLANKKVKERLKTSQKFESIVND